MPLQDEWVERLFQRFSEIYGGGWNLSGITRDLIFVMFKNGLHGLGNADIKRGLWWCEQRKHEPPPNVCQFWHWAKGLPYSVPKRTSKSPH